MNDQTRKRLHPFAIFLFVVAAIGLVITVLTAREVLQSTMAKPLFQTDPGWRGDAINGYVVYVASQAVQLFIIPLALGAIVQMLSARRQAP